MNHDKDTVTFDPVGDAVKQLRILDSLPDNLDVLEEVGEAVLRRSNLPKETVDLLVSRQRRNQRAKTP